MSNAVFTLQPKTRDWRDEHNDPVYARYTDHLGNTMVICNEALNRYGLDWRLPLHFSEAGYPIAAPNVTPNDILVGIPGTIMVRPTNSVNYDRWSITKAFDFFLKTVAERVVWHQLQVWQDSTPRHWALLEDPS
jgi:hypothetical protein